MKKMLCASCVVLLTVVSLGAWNNGQTGNTGTDTIIRKGRFDLSNPFFRSLGTNDRACVNCHEPENAWSTTPTHIQQHFDVDGGITDPLFRPVDGAN